MAGHLGDGRRRRPLPLPHGAVPLTNLRSVAGIVIEAGLVFVAKRVPGGDLGEKWEFPGGKVEAGESDEDALRREFLEEFAVPVNVGAKLAESSFSHAGCEVALRAYSVSFSSKDFRLSEHTEWRWIRLEGIDSLDFADSDLKLLPQLKRIFSTERVDSRQKA